MDSLNGTLMIFGMFVATFSIRYLPFALADRLQFSAWVQEALSYVPIAALTAIIAPIILYRDQVGLDINLHNAHLISATAAFLTAYRYKKLLPTVVVGLVVFFLHSLAL